MRDPGSFSTTPNNVELAWHYYLAGLDSGFLYYGVADQIKRCGVAQSNVIREIDGTVNSGLAQDTTSPTVFLPQRHPWNPGAQNFGVQYNYTATTAANTDFWIWTYAYDASGMGSVTLKYRSNGTAAFRTATNSRLTPAGQTPVHGKAQHDTAIGPFADCSRAAVLRRLLLREGLRFIRHVCGLLRHSRGSEGQPNQHADSACLCCARCRSDADANSDTNTHSHADSDPTPGPTPIPFTMDGTADSPAIYRTVIGHDHLCRGSRRNSLPGHLVAWSQRRR